MPSVLITIADVGDGVAINVIHNPPVDIDALESTDELTNAQFLSLVAVDALHEAIDSDMNADKAAQEAANGKVDLTLLEKKHR